MKKYYKSILIIVIVAAACFAYAHINKMHSVFNEDVDSFVSTDVASQEEYVQQFVSEEKALDGVAVKFAVTGEQIDQVNLVYSVEDENGQIMREGVLSGDQFANQKYNKLVFDRIENAKNKTFVFKCHLENNDADNGVSFQLEEENLVMKYYMSRFDLETFIVACALCLYVVVFMKILIKLFKE